MKRILLLAAGLSLGFFANAQKPETPGRGRITTLATYAATPPGIGVGDKVTKNGDTDQRSHILTADSLFLYYVGTSPFDSGYLSGTNAYGDKGFAERFDVKAPDSTVLPIGVFGYVHGRATSTSSKTLRAAVWAQGPATTVSGRPHLFFKGVPTGSPLNSATRTFAQLRDATGVIDTLIYMQFPTVGSYVADSFFAGFDFGTGGYSWLAPGLGGDTLSLVMNKSMTGGRHGDGGVASPGYLVQGADTVINVQNATQLSSGTWVDNLNGGGNGLFNNFFIGVIFRVKITGGVSSITRNDLTVYGTVPNPATNSTSLKLSLKSATDVMLQVMDMSGRIVSTQPSQHLNVGEHSLPINTSTLASGTYICTVRTAAGDAMGIEMSIVK